MQTKFGFISHTFEHKNLKGVAPSLYRKSVEVAEKSMESLPPKETCRVIKLNSLQGASVEGIVVTTWLYPRQYFAMPATSVFQKILDSVRITEREGARIVGLGGYNSIVPPGAGLRVARNSRIGITNGNSYTIILAVEGTKAAVQRAGLRFSDLAVAVIGATGSVGGVISELVAMDKPGALHLVARNEARLRGRTEALLRKTGYRATYSTDLAQSVRKADIIISATSSPDTVIDVKDVLPGTIVCDVAVPHDIAERVVMERDDVLVFEGGVAKAPNGTYQMKPDFTGDLGLLPGELYACFCETAILAMEGRFDHFSLDGITVDVVRTIKSLADKHGFSLAPLRNKKQCPIPDDTYREIGALLKERKRMGKEYAVDDIHDSAPVL